MNKHSIYTLKLARRGIDIGKYREVDLMETVTVFEAMVSDIITVQQNDTVKEVGLKIKTTNHRGFPVLDESGKLVGIVTRKDINRALGKGDAHAEVNKIMTREVIVCYPNESLKSVLHRMAEKNIGRIPVVDRNNKELIIGLVTRKSLITAYNQALENIKSRTGDKIRNTLI
jgi:CIC family chloride channel protein